MESLKDVEEGVVKREPCIYCTQLDCINIDKVLAMARVETSEQFCGLCLKARLVREIKLLRVVGH